MFSNMLVAEKRLLEHCKKGKMLNSGKERPTVKMANNEIRGEFLRTLILSNNQEINESGNKYILKIDPKGVMFSGIYISGTFDFSFCSTDLQFSFKNSRFENKLDLSDSKIRFLSLIGSIVPSFDAFRLVCESDIFLEDGFEANGKVNFNSAQIGSSLGCDNGKFNNERGDALNCDRAKIVGSVFLRGSFEANGKVNFISAQIGSNLECINGKFINKNEDALNCDRTKIGGSVLLGDGFEANGKVNFNSAQIGSSLVCDNGKFNNERGDALNCDRVKIGGSVFLRGSFEANGKVNFISAQIGSNLECDNGKFNNERGDALNCDRVKIGGSVFLRGSFEANGKVNFISAQIGSNLECNNGKFNNESGDALNCNRVKIDGSVFLNNGFEANGKVNFHSCFIGKSLIFSNIKETSFLTLNSAQISRLKLNIDTVKKIDLDGCIYEHLDSLIFLKWVEKMPKEDDFKPQPYKQLAKVLRNMGHHTEADDVMIKYNDIMTDKSENWFIKKLKQIYGVTAGYGYKPMSVIKWMSIVWFLCSLFYWNASKVAVFAPSNPLVFQKKDCYQCNVNSDGTPWSDIFSWEKYNSSNNWIDSKLEGEYTTFSPFWYSLDVILPIVDLQVEKDWAQYIPSNDWTFNDFTRWLMWFEILFGWIYSLILVAILSGLAKNEKD